MKNNEKLNLYLSLVLRSYYNKSIVTLINKRNDDCISFKFKVNNNDLVIERNDVLDIGSFNILNDMVNETNYLIKENYTIEGNACNHFRNTIRNCFMETKCIHNILHLVSFLYIDFNDIEHIIKTYLDSYKSILQFLPNNTIIDINHNSNILTTVIKNNNKVIYKDTVKVNSPYNLKLIDNMIDIFREDNNICFGNCFNNRLTLKSDKVTLNVEITNQFEAKICDNHLRNSFEIKKKKTQYISNR